MAIEDNYSLNLKQLKVFHHAARHMSFTKAAADLFITQSAVTKAIDALEESLGVRLFVREHNTLLLTEAGEVLKTFAERINRLAVEAEEAVGALAANPGGVLRLGTTKTFARYLMPVHIIRFHEEFPKIRITMTEGTSRELVEGVVNGRLDAAVVGRVDYPETVASVPFAHRPSDPLLVVMPANHRLAGKESLSMRDLAGEPLLLREKGSGVRQKVMNLFGREGINPSIVLEAANVDFTKELIRRGAGISILGLISVENELSRGDFKAARIDDADMTISIDLIYPSSGYKSLATRSFLEFISR